SFGDGNYTSLAFFAQTRTNCEVVEFALVEGPGKAPTDRVGDPNNAFTDGNDKNCQPSGLSSFLPKNQDTINTTDNAQKAIAAQKSQQITGLDRETLSRLMAFYDVAELRLAPNPLHQLFQANALDPTTQAEITQGQKVFGQAGCGNCHDPNSLRHPFADGLDH